MVEIVPRTRGSSPRDQLVGRTEELGQLRAAWERALAGERRVVFLSGEPGIGKTHLCDEFAREAERGGALVLYGRCDEDPVTPYEPFVQVVQQLAAGASRVPSDAGSAQAVLADLAPAFPARTSRSSKSAPPDPGTRRLLLFESVRSLFREVAAASPLLIMLDDLHWADSDTVRMLRYLARGSWGRAALLVVAFRDTELASDHPLRAAVADLHSDRIVDRIDVRALDLTNVQALAERHTGRPVTAEEARRLHEASGGNPFFVKELVALMDQRDGAGLSLETAAAAEGAPLTVNVREVIARRLAKLSPGCRDLLARSAVLGSTAELGLLRALWDDDAESLAASLGEAVSAALLVEEGSEQPPCYRFTHALTQQALYQGVPLPIRQQLHLRAAQAIETQLSRRSPEAAGQIANHYRKAGDTAKPEEALPHALAAAETALAALATEDAVAWWEWALALMEAVGSDEQSRAGLLERMAGVLDVAREQSRATCYWQRALSLYEDTGDPIAVATARSRLGRAHANGNLRSTDLVTARAHFEAAAPLLAEAPSRRLAALHAGWAEMGISSFQVADLRHAAAACQLSAELGWGTMETTGHIAAGMLAYHLGDIDQGLQLFGRARQEARAGRCRSIRSGGVLRSHRGAAALRSRSRDRMVTPRAGRLARACRGRPMGHRGATYERARRRWRHTGDAQAGPRALRPR